MGRAQRARYMTLETAVTWRRGPHGDVNDMTIPLAQSDNKKRLTNSNRRPHPGHTPWLMRPLLYRLVIVARRFGEGDRRGSAGVVIIIVARPVHVRPFLERSRATIGEKNIHCRYPSVKGSGPVAVYRG